MIALENRYLRAVIIVDQGADLLELRYKPLDLDVLWHAPQELLPPGRNVPPTQRKEGSFLDYLHGGWQEVLPNGHLDCHYKGASLGQHGEVSLLPWSARVIEDTPDRVSVLLSVRTRRTPFRLERTVTIAKEAASLILDEKVTNDGGEEMHLMWGHHPTFGEPFLGAGCRLKLPDGSRMHVPTFNAGAARRYAGGQSSAWPEAAAPYGSKLRADLLPGREAGTDDSFYVRVPEGWYELQSDRLKLRLEWDAGVFPYVWCWQVYGGAAGFPYYGRTYNMAVEPFSSPIATLADCAAQGTAMVLGPGASKETRVTVHMSLPEGE
ncbi:aldose 1-epimerase [Paenibacillus sp. GCM10027626]|uniref:aldose 1-epimerase n=1 Tax=Paenibacillus sp. GCM10027626 TaxID=3273411 RepID=UPI0036268E94